MYMKIGQYCQRQRCRHVELEQFWQAFASRGFVSDSWAFLLKSVSNVKLTVLFTKVLKRKKNEAQQTHAMLSQASCSLCKKIKASICNLN